MTSSTITLKVTEKLVTFKGSLLCDEVQVTLELSTTSLCALPSGTKIAIHHSCNKSTSFIYHGTTNLDFPREVILKVAKDIKDYRTEIEMEAQLYNRLWQHADQSLVPRFYGLYMGTTNQKKNVPCLVIEKFGESLNDLAMLEKSVEFKMGVMRKLYELHAKYKVCHKSFGWSNVVFRGEDFRFVDFGEAATDHTCDSDDLPTCTGIDYIDNCSQLCSAFEQCNASIRRVKVKGFVLVGDVPDVDICEQLVKLWKLDNAIAGTEDPTILMFALRGAILARRAGSEYEEMTLESEIIPSLQDTIQRFLQSGKSTNNIDKEYDNESGTESK